MSKTFYKLNYYKPFGTMDPSVDPYDHIETIVSGIEEYVNKAQNSNISLGQEITTKNLQGLDRDTIRATGTVENLPDYIKVDVNGQIYYYYKLDNGNVMSVDENATYYDGIYHLDEYMTYIHHKMSLIYEANPTVYQLFGFDNRGKTRTTGNTTRYVIDFVEQRYLSNTVQGNNDMMIRELAYYTTPTTLFNLNFPTTTPPASVEFTGLLDATAIDTRTGSEMITPNSRGRYEYIVCKPTSVMTSDNSKTKSAHTTQKFIIIPLFEDRKSTLLEALSDFDITGTHNQIMDPGGDNQIGIFECDIPYSIFYGGKANNQYGVEFKGLAQSLDSAGTNLTHIDYFMVNNNAPMLLKIIDYTQYAVGFYGKFYNFINNIYEGTPATEPALGNPTYYKEVYNNGASNLVTDASFFIGDGDGTSVNQMGVQAYLSGQDSLNIAYNYGDSTNSKLATLDNTESINGNLSLSNMYFGSASANYFTTNATSINTSMAVRASEEKQAGTNAALDTAKTAIDATKVSKHILPGRVAADYARQAANAGIQIAKIMTNTKTEQENANAKLRSSINNLTSSPAPVLSNPSTKAVIPNKTYSGNNALFETYSIHLHPNDEKVKFIDYCHNGYPTNEIKLFQQVFNRKYMNVLHLDTTYFAEDLKNILLYNDSDKTFNTPYYNSKFLSGMNEPHKIYNTWGLINCTDYYGEDYVSNVETELPDIPTPKTHINRYITSFRDVYAGNEILSNLQNDNSSAPAGIGNDIEIISATQYGFIIQAKSSSTTYYGSITVSAIVYDGYIQDGTSYHYFLGIGFLEDMRQKDIVCPDGTKYDKKTFNKPIIFNTTASFNTINDDFMWGAKAFDQAITLPTNITKIGVGFIGYCDNYNSTITLPNGLLSIGGSFLSSDPRYNKDITIPNTVTFIGGNFMGDLQDMVHTINFGSLQPSILKETIDTLATSGTTVPCYETGITITSSNKAAGLSALPNKTTWPFRKLI